MSDSRINDPYQQLDSQVRLVALQLGARGGWAETTAENRAITLFLSLLPQTKENIATHFERKSEGVAVAVAVVVVVAVAVSRG